MNRWRRWRRSSRLPRSPSCSPSTSIGSFCAGSSLLTTSIPVGADFDARLALRQVADALGESFRLALRIASPYVIYALIVNLALALVNRLTPQIQVFFVGTPFVAAGGLMLLYFTIKPAIDAFLIGFAAWLHTG